MRLCTAAFLSLVGESFERKDFQCLDIAAGSQDPGCFENPKVYKQLLNTEKSKRNKTSYSVDRR